MNPLLSPFTATFQQMFAMGLIVIPATPQGDAVGCTLTSSYCLCPFGHNFRLNVTVESRESGFSPLHSDLQRLYYFSVFCFLIYRNILDVRRGKWELCLNFTEFLVSLPIFLSPIPYDTSFLSNGLDYSELLTTLFISKWYMYFSFLWKRWLRSPYQLTYFSFKML